MVYGPLAQTLCWWVQHHIHSCCIRTTVSICHAARTRPGGVSLMMLIDDGLLTPGTDNLLVEYKSMTSTGSLLPDGRITCTIKGQQHIFESPSAFSIFIKRLANPTRKADDGWKTIKYDGKVRSLLCLGLRCMATGLAAQHLSFRFQLLLETAS